MTTIEYSVVKTDYYASTKKETYHQTQIEVTPELVAHLRKVAQLDVPGEDYLLQDVKIVYDNGDVIEYRDNTEVGFAPVISFITEDVSQRSFQYFFCQEEERFLYHNNSISEKLDNILRNQKKLGKFLGPVGNRIKGFSLNINSDRRVEEFSNPKYKDIANAFPDFRFINRWPLLRQQFDYQLNNINEEHRTDFFMLQEASKNATNTIKRYFNSKLGFKVVITEYSLHPNSFNLIFAYNESRVNIDYYEHLYYTRSGKPTSNFCRDILSKQDLINRHAKTEFEKSAQIFRIKTPLVTLNVINTHLGLTNEHKLSALKKLLSFFDYDRGLYLISGDFNQFDMSKPGNHYYKEQISLLTDNGFVWETESAKNSWLNTSFMAFPYDIFRFLDKEEIEKFYEIASQTNSSLQVRQFILDKIMAKNLDLSSVCMDAVFTKNFNHFDCDVRFVTTLGGHKIYPEKAWVTNKIFQYIYLYLTDYDRLDQPPPLSSDHFGMEIHITKKACTPYIDFNISIDIDDFFDMIQPAFKSSISRFCDRITIKTLEQNRVNSYITPIIFGVQSCAITNMLYGETGVYIKIMMLLISQIGLKFNSKTTSGLFLCFMMIFQLYTECSQDQYLDLNLVHKTITLVLSFIAGYIGSSLSDRFCDYIEPLIFSKVKARPTKTFPIETANQPNLPG